VPRVKTGHVVPGVDVDRVKKRLAEVRGALVECPMDFLIDDKEFVNGRVLTLPCLSTSDGRYYWDFEVNVKVCIVYC